MRASRGRGFRFHFLGVVEGLETFSCRTFIKAAFMLQVSLVSVRTNAFPFLSL